MIFLLLGIFVVVGFLAWTGVREWNSMTVNEREWAQAGIHIDVIMEERSELDDE